MKFPRSLSLAALVLFTCSTMTSCILDCDRCRKKREVHAAAIQQQHDNQLPSPPNLATAPPAQ